MKFKPTIKESQESSNSTVSSATQVSHRYT